MSAPINDGGPAFPSVYYSEPIGSIGPQLTIKGGATLRDYFAAAALKGMLANPNIYDICDEAAVLESFEIADAMLKARGGK
jgi:hypothetical protein